MITFHNNKHKKSAPKKKATTKIAVIKEQDEKTEVKNADGKLSDSG